MSTQLPELANKRYVEFVESFNNLNLVEYKIDVSTFDYKEKLSGFYTSISSDEKLFKYLVERDKLLFHKKYKLSFLPKINLYNLIESNIESRRDFLRVVSFAQ